MVANRRLGSGRITRLDRLNNRAVFHKALSRRSSQRGSPVQEEASLSGYTPASSERSDYASRNKSPHENGVVVRQSPAILKNLLFQLPPYRATQNLQYQRHCAPPSPPPSPPEPRAPHKLHHALIVVASSQPAPARHRRDQTPRPPASRSPLATGVRLIFSSVANSLSSTLAPGLSLPVAIASRKI